jgi:hypothetical protein
MNPRTWTLLTTAVWSLAVAPTSLAQNDADRPPGAPPRLGGPPT